MTQTKQADKDPDQQPEAVARKGDAAKPGERSAERGYIDHGNPADDGFYDTPPGAPVNEGFSDMENVDNK